MPAAITSIWLTIGGALIVGLLIAGAILPRPNAEYAVSDLISWAKTDDREASEHSIIRKGDAKGDGAASKDKSENKPDAKPGDGTKKGDEGKTKENPDADTSRNKDGEKPKDSSQSNAGKQSDSGKKSSDNDSAKKSEPKGERSSNEKGSDSGESSQKPDWFKPMHSIMEGVGPILKFIVYGVAILAGIFILIRFMANFTGWAQSFMESLRAFWESLFGGGKREELSAEEEQKIAEMIERPRPFSGFANPFQFGISQKSPEYLVRYSFEALQSWAWERGMARQPDQTPLEFADRLSESVPGLANDFQRMAELYAQVCYARGRLPGTCLPLVKEFWHRLTTLGYEVPQVVG